MAKSNPKAWFAGYIARISYKSVDKWAVCQAKFKPYFSTWREAHDWMTQKASADLLTAKKAYERAHRHAEKVKAMKEPTP